MKIVKKIVTFCCIMMMTVSIAACGGTGGATDGETTGANSIETTSTSLETTAAVIK